MISITYSRAHILCLIICVISLLGLRVYLQEFERLNPGGCHEVFLDENGVYDGVFSMAGIAPSMFKEVCQRYLSIDACVHFLAEGVQSGHSFIGEFETATHSILPGALGLGYGETNDCWMRFMTCIIKGFKNESLEHESYFNNPQTIVAGACTCTINKCCRLYLIP